MDFWALLIYECWSSRAPAPFTTPSALSSRVPRNTPAPAHEDTRLHRGRAVRARMLNDLVSSMLICRYSN